MSDAKKLAEYEKLKKKLHQQIIDKKNVDKQLTLLEEEIYTKETLYLTDSFAHHSHGNIIKGFDSFTRGHGSGHGHGYGYGNHGHGGGGGYGSARRRNSFTDDDRIFLLSSAIYVKHLQKKNKEYQNEQNGIAGGSAGGNGNGNIDGGNGDDDDDDEADETPEHSSAPATGGGRKRRKENDWSDMFWINITVEVLYIIKLLFIWSLALKQK